MKYLIKIDRLSAWILLVCMTLYFISGYGMTKGIISAETAAKLHTSWLSILILLSFIIHTAFATHLALKRWGMWNTFSKIIWAGFYIFFFSYFIYVDRFYTPKSHVSDSSSNTIPEQNTPAPNNNSDKANPNPNSDSSDKSPATTFTLAELKKYDGRNGQPAYVAVDGVIYDVSRVFQNGYHFGHWAGNELSNAFYLKHAKSAITKYPVVGKLV